MKKIFVDCSYLYDHIELNTGIQRVVRRVIENLESLSQTNEIEVIPVNISHHNLFKVELKELYEKKDRYVPVSTDSCRSDGTLRNRLMVLYNGFRNLLVTLLPRRKFKEFVFAPRHRLGMGFIIEKVLLQPVRRAMSIQRADKNRLIDGSVSIEKGDVLVLIDSSWYMNIWPTVKKFKQQEATVIGIIYDLIPITNAEFCDAFLACVFKTFFYESLNYVDGYIAISDTVKKGLISFLTNEFGNTAIQEKKFDYFFLGSDFSSVENQVVGVRAELKKSFTGSPTYLIVSTVEPRKNHEYLLDVFDMLWAQGMEIKLCIIGRMGWRVEKTAKRIYGHRFFNEKLLYWSDLNDEELQFCYENSKMLLFPSIVEGFGLPIVESLTNGLPVLASDIPIHKEVGKHKIGYFDLQDTHDLKNQLVHIEAQGIPVELIPDENYKWQDWHESTKELLEKINLMIEPHGCN